MLLFRTAALIALCTMCSSAQDRRTNFPTDTKDPQQVGGATLLEAVCKGAVTAGEELGCSPGCPDYTSFGEFGDRFPWSLTAVTLGHFLSATSEDAVLSMTGCEPHATNNGGSILLTKKSQIWSMLWYKAAVDTNRCHKVRRRDGREFLVCIGTDVGQGNNATDVYIEDLLDPRPVMMAGDKDDGTFFSAFDDSINCGLDEYGKDLDTDSLIRTFIDKVEFMPNRSGESPRISITAAFGKKKMNREEAQACQDKHQNVLPATKTYRMDFTYNGRRYEPTPLSVNAVRIFNSR